MVVAVLYSTREGQARRIAEHVAARLSARGCLPDVFDLGQPLPLDFALSRYKGVLLVASIHIGRHEPEMIEFVRQSRTELSRVPTCLLSVSLSQAGAEDVGASDTRRRRARAEVVRMIQRFKRQTGFDPTLAHPVAGALLYRQYGILLRVMMRFISKLAGGSTDTSRDHEYTDWGALGRYTDEFASRVEQPG